MTGKIHSIKLKAGALQYTIFISVVIALLVFAFISLTYVQEKLRIKSALFEDVVQNSDLGFQYLSQKDIHFNEQTSLVLDRETVAETVAIKKHWGIFDIATISSTRGKEALTKTALLGGYQKEKTALYLVDEFQPIIVVGDAKIEGKAYLPEQGIKAGSIAGHSYQNQQLVYGPIARSTAKLPEIINREYVKTFKNEINDNRENEYIDYIENSKIVNSFDQPPKILWSRVPIDLQFIELTGNIIIQSETEITVFASAKLKDIILVAPEIEIRDQVEGNFQAFAEKNIKIGKDCLLSYPSALVLIEENIITNAEPQTAQEKINQITIDNGSDVRGIVAFLSENETTANYKPQVVIEENATITGEVFCDQNVELKGTVNGSVYTKGFIANQFGSIYKNHICNGKILSSDLSEQYSGLQMKDSKLTVAKWLNY